MGTSKESVHGREQAIMITFVTSFSEEGFKKYAKNMLLSVVENWKDDLKLVAYFHDCSSETVNDFPSSPKIEYRNLNLVKPMLSYRERMKTYDGTMGGKTPYNWRLDAVKWCHKVYALTQYALYDETVEHGNWLCWLDADTITTKPFSKDKLLEILARNADIVHLGRKDADYSETSFIAFNMFNKNVSPFLLADLRGCYDIGEVTAYREWHDGFIFERLLKIYQAHGAHVQNLSANAVGLAAFAQSPLSQYMVHFKGNLKDAPTGVAPDVRASRYKKLADLVRQYVGKKDDKKAHIVEVGTWNGGRAIEMSLAAFETLDDVHYTGYDLFEEATEELDKVELNSKRHNTIDAIRERLMQFADKMKEKGKTFTCELHKGDSKVTLTNSVANLPPIDFAYIDGGHSETTVVSDYENLKNVPVIVFDDYFSKDADGKILGEEHQGTNRLFKKLKDEGKRIAVVPSTDKVKGGGITHLVVLLNNKELEDIRKDIMMVPIVVQPRDSMPKEYILNNIKENMKLIKDWKFVRKYTTNDEHAIIVSAGPSTDFEKVKELSRRHNSKIICVKHSYPTLLKNGIVPYACVILDPRPVTGTSTHGIVRTELFKDIRKETKFLLASMTDTSVTKLLMEKTDNIYGWHAFSEAIQQAANPKNFTVETKLDLGDDATFVTGGTCSAMRAIGMFHIVGFRQFHLFGFDASIPNMAEEMKNEKLEDDRKKYIPVECHGKSFWTTGELLALAQDCERLFDNKEIDMTIHFHGKDTLISQLYDKSYHGKKEYYSEYFPKVAA
jgi:hypothetical protein